MTCVFCEIVEGKSPASIIFEDDSVIAFPTIRATRPGESLVIPKQHIDHFTDLPDALSTQIMMVGQRIGRKMMEVLQPLRIGFVVHGFGVAHAHLIVLPMHRPTDITSARHARHTEEGALVFDEQELNESTREDLDALAEILRIESLS